MPDDDVKLTEELWFNDGPRRLIPWGMVDRYTDEEAPMKAKLITFGEIEIDGEAYLHDVVITAGKITKRKKKPSKQYRDRYGHTPLSVEEKIPWGRDRLIVGTGAYGRLPIMDEIHQPKQRGVEIVAMPTEEACQLLGDLKAKKVYAVLHVTC